MRTSARVTGTAAAIAAVLLSGGCGQGGDGEDEKPAAEKSQNTGVDPETERQPGTVQGIWRTSADGEELVLSIFADGVSLVRESGTCDGRVTEADQPTLTLTCNGDQGDNGTERSNGTVEKVDSEELTISWNSGATDTYTKIADAPKDMPTDLGDLEDLIPQN
ncbi:hypothetical protein JJV70_10710 [Streptomyces sp. JJ66]|uniref:hypothetical protein n=1 Tax=Streptomyces sp. JJ66 TaxID=2803843 RepID=UPI001C56CD26|nr:hypothetical protein [Streptomyces sp. JJ66]MBW1602568.1 hypothetical protein [Streptomyces sp. JJ66]